MENSDAKLISDYLSGESESLRLLIARHLDDVYNFVFRLTSNVEDSEDITQEKIGK